MSPNNNNYRATFILDLRETEEAPETVIENLKGDIAAVEGTVSQVNNLGQRDFARVTDVRRPTGHYVQIDFAGPATVNSALQERLRLNKVAYRLLIQEL